MVKQIKLCRSPVSPNYRAAPETPHLILSALETVFNGLPDTVKDAESDPGTGIKNNYNNNNKNSQSSYWWSHLVTQRFQY